MSAPALLAVSPADGNTGIPTGTQIKLDFDRGIDALSIKDFIVLYGADFDQTSGPDTVYWIDQDTGDNPYFLRSPGFKGLVDIQTRIVYYDLDTQEDVSGYEAVSEADEVAYGTSGVGHRVYVTPTSGVLAADTQYTLHVLGDPDTQGTGISSRTVFDTVADVGNTSDTGLVFCAGGYTGTLADTVIVEITTAGDIGVAKYKWYYQSAGAGSAVYDKLSNRRYRKLADGVQIRFSGESFAVGDQFTIAVEPAQRLATSVKVVFTTNDGSYTSAPDVPSVPATSTAPDTTIPPAPGQSTEDEFLQVEESSPPDGSYNISKKTRTITVLFSEQLDPSAIDALSVRLFKYPVLGYWQGQAQVVELQKKLSVSGQTLTIEF